MDEITPANYRQVVDAFTKQSAVEFRQASQSVEQQRLACCRYFKRGRTAGLSNGELVDFLGVSSPSVLEMAGYPDDGAQRVMEMIGNISDDEIERVMA